jgi:hypothetical protein
MNTHLLVLLAFGSGAVVQAAHAGITVDKRAAQPDLVRKSSAAVELAATLPAPTTAVLPIGAATDGVAPAPPRVLDWSYTPRHSFQARRR